MHLPSCLVPCALLLRQAMGTCELSENYLPNLTVQLILLLRSKIPKKSVTEIVIAHPNSSSLMKSGGLSTDPLGGFTERLQKRKQSGRALASLHWKQVRCYLTLVGQRKCGQFVGVKSTSFPHPINILNTKSPHIAQPHIYSME